MILLIRLLSFVSLCVTSSLADSQGVSRLIHARSTAGTAVVSPPAKADPVLLAPTASVCDQKTGFINVTSTTINGFLAAKLNSVGEYATVVPNPALGALHVSFQVCEGGQAGNTTFDIKALNAAHPDIPYLGAVNGPLSPQANNGPLSMLNSMELLSTEQGTAFASGNESWTATPDLHLPVPRGPAADVKSSRPLNISAPTETNIWTTDPRAQPMPLCISKSDIAWGDPELPCRPGEASQDVQGSQEAPS
ncbi:hypothetical protein GSI_03164 [Ganoderma sinense ZZ0214-1]|uniref:Uncharacterized protein n=1 Tax=Ganoderma sinense ZZ0214-1 TaxID=1077348 RepID=A0A2G8SKU4_9APHY|nr:hypothetical protein GSI_03164 [Ganoderma sinense ZZ0214-1]